MCLEICPSLLVFEPSDKEETLAARHMGLTDASGSSTDEKSVPRGGVGSTCPQNQAPVTADRMRQARWWALHCARR